MENFSEYLAEECMAIINKPENNIDRVDKLLNIKEFIELIHLSPVKVFKNIIPLYKIRIYSDKAKHKNGCLDLTEYDRK
ncbi:MAG: hypothetical protein KDH96_11305 [Candidatus Riesia sp.]|nr:hypothetical protein [Romboutsia sp.]MCB1713029.1 hypothetical protein [Candidatus Riesia sp.]